MRLFKLNIIKSYCRLIKMIKIIYVLGIIGLMEVLFNDYSYFLIHNDFSFIVSVCYYSDLEVNMKSILKDNKGKSGVYR